jgi:drug/metabolite transporter (DMT)-like permease
VGVTVLDATLTSSQWLGASLVVVAVSALVLHEARARQPAVTAAVDA